MKTPQHMHLSAEQIQALLEGELPSGGHERRRLEEHVAGCARCAAELDAWRTLFADLGELASLPLPRPSAGFADRVMSEVRLPAPREERAGWLSSLFRPSSRHLPGDVLQDLADGLLPARRAARAHAHLAACTECTGEIEAWRGVMASLARAARFSPGEAFADRVLSALERPAAVERPRVTEITAWQRALVLARRTVGRLVPRTRRAWAALSGVAVTPAAIFGLVLWVVFSHPTLTPGALFSFATWQVGDLLAAGWNVLVAGGPEVVSATGFESVVQALAPLVQSPLALAGGALAYSAVAAIALRVLHKNLVAQRRHARVSPR